MKAFLVLLLALSLAGNAVLYFRKKAEVPPQKPTETTLVGERSPGRSSLTAEADASQGASRATDASISQWWANLQTSDAKVLAERLRAAGFSPALIRAIITAQVQESFAARRRALLAQQDETPYWKSRTFGDVNVKTMAALRQLGREQSDLLKQVLGSTGLENEERAMYQRRQFGNLPTDKVEQLQSILADYSDLRNQVYSTANGVMLPEDREKILLLEREQRADLASVLTPDEFENYELRNSATANTLRSQLALFNPTEAEFRAIFQVQRAFDEKYGSAGSVTSAEQFRQRQTRQQELVAQVATILDPARLDAYRQSIDPAYQMVNRLVARLELPATTVTQVVNAQQDFTKRAAAIRSDKNLNGDIRAMQLNALAQEATAALTTTLGTRGLEAYKQYGGQWLQNLAPRPTGGTPAP